MSEKKLEECSLEEATHIEIGGKVHKLDSGIVHKRICFGSYHGITICYDEWREQNSIYTGVFPVLGIKPMREIKPKPIEFEHIFTFEETSLGIIPCEAEGKRFRCVEILEDEE